MKYWDYDTEFKGIRKYYQLISRMFQNFHFMVKWWFKRHDLLASDSNINPEHWNFIVMAMRDSYAASFEVWAKQYMYDEQKLSRRKGRHVSREEYYDIMYNELSQKGFRFLIDFIATMYLEDTVYRELINMFFFEMQFRMNAHYNPECKNQHVWYCNYNRNDLVYKQITENLEKARTMNEKYHQQVNEGAQAEYAKKRMAAEKELMEKRLKELEDKDIR